MDKKLDAFELSQLINRIKAWPPLERVLGMEDETEVAIVEAYFPPPMAEHIEFEDTLLPELNDKYNGVREDVTSAIEKMAQLDAQAAPPQQPIAAHSSPEAQAPLKPAEAYHGRGPHHRCSRYWQRRVPKKGSRRQST